MMLIRKIKIENFKSFRETEIEFSKFNVLIGANASGKSNFINIFRFLKDLIDSDLENAISTQGGLDLFINNRSEPKSEFFLEIIVESPDKEMVFGFQNEELHKKDRKFEFYLKNWTYRLNIGFNLKGKNYQVIEEKIDAKFDIIDVFKQGKKENKTTHQNENISIENQNGLINIIFPDIFKPWKDSMISPIFPAKFKKKNQIPHKSSLLERDYLMRWFFPLSFEIRHFFYNISIYDIDPRKTKRSRAISSKKELDFDGENLAIVLNSLLKSPKKKEKYLNIIQEFLPFVNSIEVKPLEDNTLITFLGEKFNPEKKVPASHISDGTLNIAALIIPLIFENRPTIIIEEPERNIHPSLCYKIIELFKDTSTNLNKQIFITTHNPEIVRNAGLDNIYLVKRNYDGFSKIIKPENNQEVKIFLEKNLGLNDLYVKNLLELE